MTLTLLRQGHPLADPAAQRALLERPHGPAVPFDRRVADAGIPPVTAGAIDVLQINVGKLCNQTCAHCHVDAGPERREVMTRETMEDQTIFYLLRLAAFLVIIVAIVDKNRR